jgi:hypothetical protein
MYAPRGCMLRQDDDFNAEVAEVKNAEEEEFVGFPLERIQQ